MESNACRICHRLYEYNGTPYCPDCKVEDEVSYKPIRDYVRDHPGVSAFMIMDEFKVSLERLKRYLRDGLLEICGPGNSFLKCEACKKPVRSGRYCDECVVIINRELKKNINNFTYLPEVELKGAARFISFAVKTKT